MEGVHFTYRPDNFDPDVIERANKIAPYVRRLEDEILKAAQACAAQSSASIPGDSARLLTTDISDYMTHGQAIVEVVGGNSWGDIRVSVTLLRDQIITVEISDHKGRA